MGFWDFLTGGTKEETDATSPEPSAKSPSIKPPRAESKEAEPALAGPAAAPKPAPAKPPPLPKPQYGIDKANELMQALDVDDDPSTVVRIVRKTLESTGVSVPELISDAKQREGDLRENIAKRRATIAELERQIDVERKEIATLEAALALTGKTRGHLELADQNRTKMMPAVVLPSVKPPPVPETSSSSSSSQAPPPLPSKVPPKAPEIS